MKQKTSFFNWGLCRGYLKRCWPLWACYFAALLFILPLALPSSISNVTDAHERMVTVNRFVLYAGQRAAALSAFMGCAAAMAVYSYMYNNRAVGMVNALPIRRETAFCTAYITGLAPMLLADLLTVLITFAADPTGGLLQAKNLWIFFAYAVMSNVAFYGFAVFCAVLTGNLLVLPAVYVVLNLVADVICAVVNSVLDCLVYGFYTLINTAAAAERLSPMAFVLWDGLNVYDVTALDADGLSYSTGEFTLSGVGTLGAYCAAGLILAVCALLIYRKRDMERAGDVVAVPALKPVFKYCMCFGTAGVFTVLIYGWVFDSLFDGRAEAAVVLALLLVGAFIGYFAAEMLMQKTVSVFKSGWRGLEISCLILAALALAAEFDLFGYERRVPELNEIESVTISYHGEDGTVKDAENVAAFAALHGEIIADKDINEQASYSDSFMIDYTLKNGRTLTRRYYISDDRAEHLNKESNINALQETLNIQEAKDSRFADFTVTESNVDYASLSGYYYDADGQYVDISINLTPAEAAEFYNNCVLKDLTDSSLGNVWTVSDSAEYYNTLSNLSFDIQIRAKPSAEFAATGYLSNYKYFTISMDAKRCVEWIEENTDAKIMSFYDADPENAETAINDAEGVWHNTPSRAVG